MLIDVIYVYIHSYIHKCIYIYIYIYMFMWCIEPSNPKMRALTHPLRRQVARRAATVLSGHNLTHSRRTCCVLCKSQKQNLYTSLLENPLKPVGMVGEMPGISNLCAPTWSIPGFLFFRQRSPGTQHEAFFNVLGVLQDQFWTRIG